MNVKRFVGRNSREAMAQVRAALGADAVVLSNRSCPEGVEILALPGSAIDSITAAGSAPAAAATPVQARGPASGPAPAAPLGSPAGMPAALPAAPPTASAPGASAAAAAYAAAVAASWAAQPEPPASAAPIATSAVVPAASIPIALAATAPVAAVQIAPVPIAPAPIASVPVASVPTETSASAVASPGTLSAPTVAAPTKAASAPTAAAPAPLAAVDASFPQAAGADAPPSAMSSRADHPEPIAAERADDDTIPVLSERLTERQLRRMRSAGRTVRSQASGLITDAETARLRTDLLGEMKALRGFIGEQVSNITWLDGVRRTPRQGRVLRKLLDNGFSAAVTRKLVTQLPSDGADMDTQRWLEQVVACNVSSDAGDGLLDAGGVFALVGPTGVGKTTTTAKVAAQFALRHGTQSIGLITVDHYRLGAHDQLRAFGKILGVPVHTAHDSATLADFLQVFVNKKLVLIDTVGVGQRDERVQELLAMLALPAIRKLVVLNAAAQAATIEDVVAAYDARSAAGIVISKVDEAVTFGGVVDCVMRHRLRVVGVADGQRVPEDWHAMAAEELARRALIERPRSVFSIEDGELPAVWTATDSVEQLHA